MDDCLKGRELESLDLCMILKILENLAFNLDNRDERISIANYVHQCCANVFVSSTVDRIRISEFLDCEQSLLSLGSELVIEFLDYFKSALSLPHTRAIS